MLLLVEEPYQGITLATKISASALMFHILVTRSSRSETDTSGFRSIRASFEPRCMSTTSALVVIIVSMRGVPETESRKNWTG